MGSASVECQQCCNKTADATRQNTDTGKDDQHCAQSRRNRQSTEKVADAQEYGLKAKEIYRNAIIHRMVGHLQAKKVSEASRSGKKRHECYHCRSKRHIADSSPHGQDNCSNCQKVGHLVQVFRSATSISGLGRLWAAGMLRGQGSKVCKFVYNSRKKCHVCMSVCMCACV